jgi:hypothetical protein
MGVLHGRISMNNSMVEAVATKHNVSAAAVMMQYVAAHNITVVTASDTRAYDVEDISMLDLRLDHDDNAILDDLQPSDERGGACSDCYHPTCRVCQAALVKIGCTPFGGARCMACAAAHSSAPLSTACSAAILPVVCQW